MNKLHYSILVIALVIIAIPDAYGQVKVLPECDARKYSVFNPNYEMPPETCEGNTRVLWKCHVQGSVAPACVQIEKESIESFASCLAVQKGYCNGNYLCETIDAQDFCRERYTKPDADRITECAKKSFWQQTRIDCAENLICRAGKKKNIDGKDLPYTECVFPNQINTDVSNAPDVDKTYDDDLEELGTDCLPRSQWVDTRKSHAQDLPEPHGDIGRILKDLSRLEDPRAPGNIARIDENALRNFLASLTQNDIRLMFKEKEKFGQYWPLIAGELDLVKVKGEGRASKIAAAIKDQDDSPDGSLLRESIAALELLFYPGRHQDQLVHLPKAERIYKTIFGRPFDIMEWPEWKREAWVNGFRAIDASSYPTWGDRVQDQIEAMTRIEEGERIKKIIQEIDDHPILSTIGSVPVLPGQVLLNPIGREFVFGDAPWHAKAVFLFGGLGMGASVVASSGTLGTTALINAGAIDASITWSIVHDPEVSAGWKIVGVAGAALQIGMTPSIIRQNQLLKSLDELDRTIRHNSIVAKEALAAGRHEGAVQRLLSIAEDTGMSDEVIQRIKSISEDNILPLQLHDESSGGSLSSVIQGSKNLTVEASAAIDSILTELQTSSKKAFDHFIRRVERVETNPFVRADQIDRVFRRYATNPETEYIADTFLRGSYNQLMKGALMSPDTVLKTADNTYFVPEHLRPIIDDIQETVFRNKGSPFTAGFKVIPNKGDILLAIEAAAVNSARKRGLSPGLAYVASNLYRTDSIVVYRGVATWDVIGVFTHEFGHRFLDKWSKAQGVKCFGDTDAINPLLGRILENHRPQWEAGKAWLKALGYHLDINTIMEELVADVLAYKMTGSNRGVFSRELFHIVETDPQFVEVIREMVSAAEREIPELFKKSVPVRDGVSYIHEFID